MLAFPYARMAIFCVRLNGLPRIFAGHVAQLAALDHDFDFSRREVDVERNFAVFAHIFK